MKRYLASLLVGAICAPQLAQAGEGPVTNGWLKLGAAYGKVPAQPAQFPGGVRTFVPVSGGAVALTNSVLSTPSGSLAVIGRTGLSAAAIGTAAARCLMMMNPYCAGAAIILTGYEWLRVKPNAGGLVLDGGQAPTSTQGYVYTCNGGTFNTGQGGNPNLACLPLAEPYARYVYRDPYYGPNGGWGWINQPTCAWQPTDTSGSCSGTWSTSQGPQAVSVYWTRATQTNQECPAYIDALDPANSKPAGSPVGPDGKCASGQYSGILPAAAGDRFAQYPKPGQSLPDVAKDAISGGETVTGDSLPSSGPATTQGPAVSSTTSTSSPPTTTTTNGTTTTTPGTTTTTTTTTTPSYTWNYGGDQITYDTTTTTQTCTGANSCNTSNAVTTVVTNSPAAATPPTEPTPDVCKTNPEAAGCAKLGTATGPDWTPTNNTITMTPASAWGAGDSSCPAAQTITLSGFAIPFDNTLMCQFFSGMRFAVLAVASIIAVMIFIGARGGAE